MLFMRALQNLQRAVEIVPEPLQLTHPCGGALASHRPFRNDSFPQQLKQDFGKNGTVDFVIFFKSFKKQRKAVFCLLPSWVVHEFSKATLRKILFIHCHTST
jgi:hypothetical protein